MSTHKLLTFTRKRGLGAFVLTMLVCTAAAAGEESAEQHGQSYLLTTPPELRDQGLAIIDGDIIVPEEYLDDGFRGTWSNNFWPNGEVPYRFDSNVNATQQQQVLDAMAEWESVANVKFIPRNGESDFAHILSASFNASQVGRQGGLQNIYISAFGNRWIIAHELAHCLGRWHEQSRADRDGYVQIEYDNISSCCSGGSSDCTPNFDIRPSGGGEYGPYDFASVMHYGRCSFSNCGPCGNSSCAGEPECRTITVLPPYDTEWQTEIGQREELSFWDTLIMSFIYPYNDYEFVDGTRTGGGSGTFLDPFRAFQSGYQSVPTGGTLWLLEPDTYVANLSVLDKAMLIEAPQGGAILVP